MEALGKSHSFELSEVQDWSENHSLDVQGAAPLSYGYRPEQLALVSFPFLLDARFRGAAPT